MNSFGRIFRLSIYGESHGPEVGVLIDGCPVGIRVSEDDFIGDIYRRAAGEKGSTTRIESDNPIIKSGIFNGYTDGSPILISFENRNENSSDYDFDGFFRPGHADFTANRKYKGYNNPNGGGHFSGRLTLPIVAAGVVAKKILEKYKIEAKLLKVGGNINIEAEIEKAIQENDSVGGVVECRISNVQISLGEPFFDSIESLISHAVYAIPGVKAIEFGEGIKSASMRGSEFNDSIINALGTTETNNAGGINGGISNGNDIYFKVFFKPTSSIGKTQNTFNFNTDKIEPFKVKGRHDVCYALRTPVIVEAIAAIVLADLQIIECKNRING